MEEGIVMQQERPLRKSTGKVVARTVHVWRSPWRQARGLMFQKPRPQTAYVFSFGRALRVNFHMFFVFHPIDLYFLDEEKRVVEVKKQFKPFTTYRPKHSFSYAVESAVGALRLRRGERVWW